MEKTPTKMDTCSVAYQIDIVNRTRGLSSDAKLVWARIVRDAYVIGAESPDRDNIAKDIGMSIKQVEAAYDELLSAGIL